MTQNGSKNVSRRKFLYTAAGLTGSALLVACGDPTATPAPAATTAAATTAAATTAAAGATTAAAAGGKKFTLALIQGVKGDPFYVTMEKGARAKAQELGVDLIVDGPAQFDAVLQTPIVDAMIARGINALIIAACDKQAMIAPLQRA